MIEDKFISINEQGTIHSEIGQALSDDNAIQALQNIFIQQGAYKTRISNSEYWVEVFDFPFVLQSIDFNLNPSMELNSQMMSLEFQYEFLFEIQMETFFSNLSEDQWGRLIGYLPNLNVKFLASRMAQEQIFDAFESYDDEFFLVGGKKFFFQNNQFTKNTAVSTENFWTQKYISHQDAWNIKQASPVLIEMWPKLKTSRSRVLVPGAGEGHDCFFLADAGQVVTGLDFSLEALQRAKKLDLSCRIKWIADDIFLASKSLSSSFDYIIEHTLFCAIDPERRDELLECYWNLLAPAGRIFGIFYVLQNQDGPPYGATEWEIKKRISKKWRVLMWNRSRLSLPNRMGRELFVLIEKK